MPKRIVPKETIEQVKQLLATKKTAKAIAKETGVSIRFITQLNLRHKIRPTKAGKTRIPKKKLRFIKKALRLAKYTTMKEIAKKAKVSTVTVEEINLREGIRNQQALNIARTRLPGKKFEAIVETLTKHPEKSFTEIASKYNVATGAVSSINKRLAIQPKEQIKQRELTRLNKPRGQKKKRYCLFSQKEKEKIIQESTPHITEIISKFTVPQNIQIPIDKLLQETKLKAFNALDKATTREHPQRYIKGIAKWTTIEYCRKEAKKQGIGRKELKALITKKQHSESKEKVTKMTNTIAFIIIKGSKFLVEKRKQTKKIDPGKTIIPGGHIEPKEEPEQALKREIEEELNIEPTKYELLCKLIYKHPKETQLVHYFVIEKWKGKIKSTEAEKLIWKKTKQYKKLDLEVDRKAIKKLLKKTKLKPKKVNN